MFGSSDSMLGRQVINAINATGIKVPAAVTDTWAQVDLLNSTVQKITPGDLTAAVAAAILAGHDPASDPAVLRVLATNQLVSNQNLAGAVAALGHDRFRAACLEHADAIVKAWRRPFNDATAALIAAHRRIGDVPLEDTGSIMRRGGDIATVWATTQEATTTIDTITTGWAALGEFTRTAPADRNHAVLRVAVVDYPTWKAKELNGKRLTPWEMLLAGLTPSLPTAREYRERIAVITSAAQAEAQTGEVDSLRSAIAGREIRTAVG